MPFLNEPDARHQPGRRAEVAKEPSPYTCVPHTPRGSARPRNLIGGPVVPIVDRPADRPTAVWDSGLAAFV